MTTQVSREKQGVLGALPNPTEADLNDPTFNAIWSVIKGWDIGVPSEYVGYTGATGSHAKAISDAIMALVQPVVTDEVADKAADAFYAALDAGENVSGREHIRAMRAALTAALPHAVTRDDVLEELERDIYELGIVGMRVEHQTLVAHWLRSRKGGA